MVAISRARDTVSGARGTGDMSRTSHHGMSAYGISPSYGATASTLPPIFEDEETPLRPHTGRHYENPSKNFQRRHAAILAAFLALAALAGVAHVCARSDATAPLHVASPNMGGHHHHSPNLGGDHEKSHKNWRPKRVAASNAEQHMNDNVPIYYAAPAGEHTGKVSMLCLSPKVWSTSMGLLLLAGYHPAEIEKSKEGKRSNDPAVVTKYKDGFNGVAAAHDALTCPAPSHQTLDKKDRYFLTRDPLDRLYSGYSGKILCDNKGVDDTVECECGYVTKYLDSVFFDGDEDSASKREMTESLESLKADWHRRNLCKEPSFGGWVGWLDHAFTKSPAFTKQRMKYLGDSW